MVGQQQVPLATTVRALRARAERIRRQELTRRAGRLRDLDARQRVAVEQLTRRLVDQLLHDPITQSTRLAADPDGHRHVDLLRFLYRLERELESCSHDPEPDHGQARRAGSRC
jgi:glutamyl-tRNA reductase